MHHIDWGSIEVPDNWEDLKREQYEFEAEIEKKFGSFDNWVKGLNSPAIFTDDDHPLAHDGPEGEEVYDEAHRIIVGNIKHRMSERGLAYDDLDGKIPDQRGEKLVGVRQIRNIIDKPENATLVQVQALCVALHCSMDYIKGTVSEPEQREGWGSPDEMRQLYETLSLHNRSIVWEVAEGLLKVQSQYHYDEFNLGIDDARARYLG